MIGRFLKVIQSRRGRTRGIIFLVGLVLLRYVLDYIWRTWVLGEEANKVYGEGSGKGKGKGRMSKRQAPA